MLRSLALILIFFCVLPAVAGTIVFLDNSVSNDTYIPSNKERQIKLAFQLGIEDLKKLYPKCKVDGKVMVGRSDLLNIVKQKDDITRTMSAKDTILVGLIHSSEALLAAKAFAGTSYVSLSSGATADSLPDVNSNFFSLANGMNRFGTSMASFVTTELNAKSIVALVPGGSYYSQQFAKVLGDKLGKSVKFRVVEIDPSRINQAVDTIKLAAEKADAVFVPGFIQEALPILTVLNSINFKKSVLGSPNWGRSRSDLELFAKAIGLKNPRVYFPVSWVEGESPASSALEGRFKKLSGDVLMGTALYTYDAVIVAGSYLCEKGLVSAPTFKKYLSENLSNVKSIRRYRSGRDATVNSRISMVIFNSDKKSFSIKKVYP